jgi:hypothetical protein
MTAMQLADFDLYRHANDITPTIYYLVRHLRRRFDVLYTLRRH